ncbi:MAG TPA: DUF4926 domain-containing protein [Phycisphaerales bacterium]|nr:DUF4926 domain-containing protein [Phycisphaerales bacterium]
MAETHGIPELHRVVLTEDLAQYALKAGDVGTVVDVASDGQGYLVEFLTLSGETVAVAEVSSSQVRAIDWTEVTHARRRAG